MWHRNERTGKQEARWVGPANTEPRVYGEEEVKLDVLRFIKGQNLPCEIHAYRYLMYDSRFKLQSKIEEMLTAQDAHRKPSARLHPALNR